ncbi:hypothetical protein [Niabella beijingensis]|uniref:hypothetical protein n=1 Tax=Niabella beijingensis TaxID=2872700 RepID=UPI001CC13B29|nr:hypothetical protein [Niabella beijingensis]MBZ4187666.1 hypothetical protein [Niabella beijingensis]
MEQINTLAAIKDNFCTQFQTFKASQRQLQSKIYARQWQIDKLKMQMEKLHGPRWTVDLLQPVVNEIKKRLPGWDYDDDQLIPLGLACRVSVFFNKKKNTRSSQLSTKKSIHIIFIPGELKNAELLYETGEQVARFDPGTIGEINGFNRVTKPLESIKEAVTFLKKQIKAQK